MERSWAYHHQKLLSAYQELQSKLSCLITRAQAAQAIEAAASAAGPLNRLAQQEGVRSELEKLKAARHK
jgi:hypothetical protein